MMCSTHRLSIGYYLHPLRLADSDVTECPLYVFNGMPLDVHIVIGIALQLIESIALFLIF